jgi:dCTP deaminase
MILTGAEILNQVRSGKITLNPFDEKRLNPNSYNYRIGHSLFEMKHFRLDAQEKPHPIPLKFDDTGYVLEPKKLYLASTLEEIGSRHYVTSLIGRSSLGRLGLFLQITADLGQLGSSHCWTLELTCVQPLRIYPGMIIGQVSFWDICGEKGIAYEGKYTKFSTPHPSELYSELKRCA